MQMCWYLQHGLCPENGKKATMLLYPLSSRKPPFSKSHTSFHVAVSLLRTWNEDEVGGECYFDFFHPSGIVANKPLASQNQYNLIFWDLWPKIIKCCGSLFERVYRARDREAIEALMSATYTVEDIETQEEKVIPVVSEQIRALMDQAIYTACYANRSELEAVVPTGDVKTFFETTLKCAQRYRAQFIDGLEDYVKSLAKAAPEPPSAAVQDSLRGLSSPEGTRNAERLLFRDEATLMNDTNALAGSEAGASSDDEDDDEEEEEDNEDDEEVEEEVEVELDQEEEEDEEAEKSKKKA